jgi:Uma2 family endonuclease
MANAFHRVRYTRAEYIALERGSNVKHEFFDGSIYAMAGGTPEHAAIAMKIGALLDAGLGKRPCRVFSSDLRVRVLATGLETYPDVTVVCGRAEIDPEDPHVLTNPSVVVEVTSPSSEEYDRGDKLASYQRIESLREVVIVSHRERLIEVFRREEDGSFTRSEARSGGVAGVASLGVGLAVDDVYRDPLAGA